MHRREIGNDASGVKRSFGKPTTPEPRPLVAIERLSGSVKEIC
jgi:hypothetical protein